MKKTEFTPPSFTKLKKQAEELPESKRLSFWHEQRKAYIQETSWSYRKVDLINLNDVYSIGTLQRRSNKSKDQSLLSIEAEIRYLKEEVLKENKSIKIDGRVKHGEKQEIQSFWSRRKNKYLTEDYMLNGYPNAHKIAKKIKADGDFSSSLSTIKDHAGLHNL